jgi:hypothetical protein
MENREREKCFSGSFPVQKNSSILLRAGFEISGFDFKINSLSTKPAFRGRRKMEFYQGEKRTSERKINE